MCEIGNYEKEARREIAEMEAEFGMEGYFTEELEEGIKNYLHNAPDIEFFFALSRYVDAIFNDMDEFENIEEDEIF